MPFGNPEPESQRGSIVQSRAARNELPWVIELKRSSTPTGLHRHCVLMQPFQGWRVFPPHENSIVFLVFPRMKFPKGITASPICAGKATAAALDGVQARSPIYRSLRLAAGPVSSSLCSAGFC